MINRIHGVDVSGWEGNVDWSLARSMIGFAYFKCTEGTSGIDRSFAANKKGCEDAGIPHAPYHYFHPNLDAELQAQHFVSHAGDHFKRYILDVEKAPVVKQQLQSHIIKFLDRVQSLTQVKCAIYTSAGYWNAWCNTPYPTWCKKYDLIVAHYTIDNHPMLPIGWTNWLLWQFTDHFWFPGCAETADGNWFEGDLNACRSWFGNYKEIDPPVYNNTRVRSLFPDLHIRHLPSTLLREVGHLSRGEIVELSDLGGKDIWIKHNRGWTCVEHDGYRYMEVIK